MCFKVAVWKTERRKNTSTYHSMILKKVLASTCFFKNLEKNDVSSILEVIKLFCLISNLQKNSTKSLYFSDYFELIPTKAFN